MSADYSSDAAQLPLAGKSILLGVSGSIAAYRAADVCSQLGKLGARVTVCLTASAAKFIGEATFRALSRNPVLTDVFVEPNHERIAHIDMAQSADLVLISPASANLLARMAAGMADDMLTACVLALPPGIPILAAPAMNTHMWNNPATAANVSLLASRGVEFIDPGSGLLACQDVGKGRLAEVDLIVSTVLAKLDQVHQNDLTGRSVVITAGATREPLDPVRFITNRSSGKMGVSLAAAASARGAKVTLVAGAMTASIPPGITVVKAETARDMEAACIAAFDGADIFIGAAAVADYSVANPSAEKLKKPASPDAAITIELVQNPDIIAGIGSRKRPGQIVVGFAAETSDVISNALQKIKHKNLDLIAANDVTAPGAGFDLDTNIVTLVRRDGTTTALPLMTKANVANRILDEIVSLLP